jgi:proline iminopeptidase
MREDFIRTEAGRLWYSVYGEEKKEVPLLVVHGGPGFISMPQTVSDFAEERPVIFYDQLGCGNSDRAKDKDYYSVKNYVNELDEVRSRLNLNEVYIMGFSWGTALICSYMLEKEPPGVKGLILSGPLLSTSMWDKDQRDNIAALPPGLRSVIEKCESSGDYGDDYQAAMMEFYRKFVCILDPWPDFLWEAFNRLSMDVYGTMWGPSEFTITGKLKDFDLYPELYRITQPVLLACGDRDEAGVKSVKDFQTAFPNAQMAVIPGASHLHQIEKPEIYKAVVSDFLRQ